MLKSPNHSTGVASPNHGHTERQYILTTNNSMTLHHAAETYLTNLKPSDDHSLIQQGVFKFVSWFGADKMISSLTPFEVGDYGEQAFGTGGGSQTADRLKEVKKFLVFAKQKGLTLQNLGPHLRVPKSKSVDSSKTSGKLNEIEITPEGHKQLLAELDGLISQRDPIARQIRRAASDKDVRENVPLEAAREQLGLVESRIRQLEQTLKVAIVIDPSKRTANKPVGVGSVVVMEDLGTGKEVKYTLVSASESDPLKRKISDVSPVGKAMKGSRTGDDIKVTTPRGPQQYRIKNIS